jgi:UPF0716 protein FxsA
MNRGEVPAQEMAEGILLAVAGALLLTPGFVTDAFGFLLLFPPTRLVMVGVLLKRVQVHTGQTPGVHPGSTAPPQSGPVTIEGDFESKNSDKY